MDPKIGLVSAKPLSTWPKLSWTQIGPKSELVQRTFLHQPVLGLGPESELPLMYSQPGFLSESGF